MRIVNFLASGGRTYTDSYYDKTDEEASRVTGVPLEVLRAVRIAGERSNENQVSGSGARGVYQFIPSTRNSVLNIYGVDAWKPEQASLAAAYLLKEAAKRNNGNYDLAIREYHGGLDRKRWGTVNQAYAQRTSAFMGKGQDTPAYTPEDTQWLNDQIRKGDLNFDQVQPFLNKNQGYVPQILDVDNMDWYTKNSELQQQQQLSQAQQQEFNQRQAQLQEQQARKKQIMEMIPKATYAAEKFTKGGLVEELHPDITGFYAELQQRFPDIRVTSGYRPGARTKSGKLSRHALKEALDIAPHPELHKFLYSSEGDGLLMKYNLGFLDETIGDNLKATGGSGAHFHIGKDSTLKGNRSPRNTAFTRGSAPDQQYITQELQPQTQSIQPGYVPTLIDADIQQEYELSQQQYIATQLQQQEEAQAEQIAQEEQRKKQIMGMIPKANYASESQFAQRGGVLSKQFNIHDYL